METIAHIGGFMFFVLSGLALVVTVLLIGDGLNR